ncbi:MAG: CTP synthase [Deltaproteobacteria bacterium]|nr:CTP synthase [Deltaproteobacteria bacterium]
MNTKFIIVTGGVLSSLGKGLAAASIGALLESRGLTVTFQKLDPYINVDPGTMNPFQHGEVFITDDGAETDLDLGHYERYTNAKLGQKNNFTSGRIYYSVITKERRGDYLGGTVQVIPHVTDEIKRNILSLVGDADVAIIEVGGTVGDIESLPFLEAIRQLRLDLGKQNVLFIHVTLVPFMKVSGEVKTKPTQHSVATLRGIGIQPDILLCRTEKPLDESVKKKISLFCNVEAEAVITAIDVESIYEVPLNFNEEKLDEIIVKNLGIWTRAPRLQVWQDLFQRIKHPKGEVNIGIAGKYVNLHESYKSLTEALFHGGIGNNLKVNLSYVDAEVLEKEPLEKHLSGLDGILVPGGFGSRGAEGKMLAAGFARRHKVPFFGICLGMQIAVVEFARNQCGLDAANSTENDQCTPHPVIYIMKEWFDYRTQRIERRDELCDKGGTMRLGSYPCRLVPGTKAAAAYQVEEIFERHRHRYEFNNEFKQLLIDKGLILSGLSPDGTLIEMVELPDHPWFVGCQFHPEFKSRPMNPHPLYQDFIKAAWEFKQRRLS